MRCQALFGKNKDSPWFKEFAIDVKYCNSYVNNYFPCILSH